MTRMAGDFAAVRISRRAKRRMMAVMGWNRGGENRQRQGEAGRKYERETDAHSGFRGCLKEQYQTI